MSLISGQDDGNSLLLSNYPRIPGLQTNSELIVGSISSPATNPLFSATVQPRVLTADVLSASSLVEAQDVAFSKMKQILQKFAADPEFADKIERAFGKNLDQEKLQSLRQDWLTGEITDLSNIEIVSQSQIASANGAFADATDQIYLAQEFITENSTNPDIIADVLLEEYGHFVDSVINTSDALGDEGAIFAALAQGQELSLEALAGLKLEDDMATVIIDGQSLIIEQDNTLSTAFNVGTLSGTRSFSGWVGSTDTNDYYRFYVGSSSNLSLNLNGLSADADVQLLNGSGSLIRSSTNSSSTAESFTQSLSPGTYYVRVYPYNSANTNYNLSLSVPTTTVNIGINQTLSGSLSTTDPTNPTRTGGYYKDDYRLTGVTVGQPVKVNLNSSTF
ncbi:MAG: pre-peptidase C-terminal domain-containing protein, partial [Planktothrix sp.]